MKPKSKQNRVMGAGNSRKSAPLRRRESDIEPVEKILGRYINAGSGERFELFLQYRNLREEFSLLDRNTLSS